VASADIDDVGDAERATELAQSPVGVHANSICERLGSERIGGGEIERTCRFECRFLVPLRVRRDLVEDDGGESGVRVNVPGGDNERLKVRRSPAGAPLRRLERLRDEEEEEEEEET
jgi:hypothetical protein